MLEQVYRVGLLGAAIALVGSIIYIAWERLMGDQRAALQEGDEESIKQVLVVGLDGAGKTSILHSLSTNTVKRSDGPTMMFNSVCVQTEDAEIEFLEVGGNKSLRKCWPSYLPGSQALVYVVDSADRNQMPLAKKELHQLVQGYATLPVVVLANKQDIKGACTISEIHEQLSLEMLGDKRKLFLIGTHVAEDGSQIPTSIQDAKELIAQLVIY
ncbi:ADP-ribosylation factor-like protein 9 isoform X1 [Chiloscyllium punctatum]|uniref:ADP-ribosylation factor-like protein 9 isoform X1 n=1 Tax=Chiloscyllium punctatum TaxID=137246 RepID=UPI003B6415FC